MKCKTCGKTIRIGKKGKLSSIRHHYKEKHPQKWKESIKRGAKKRKKNNPCKRE